MLVVCVLTISKRKLSGFDAKPRRALGSCRCVHTAGCEYETNINTLVS